ncbi:MAG: fructosamine kinase family protein [Acidimicrobiia bacterium]|jgi:fructosamine-3-kinase
MSWATVEHIVRSDGAALAVKHTRYDARLEARGLRLLEEAGAPVPTVIEVTADRLVMTWVDGPADWEQLGRTLAEVHRTTDPRFGLDHDNLIGGLAQHNTPRDRWGTFYAENRILDHLSDPAVPPELARRLRTACEGPLQVLLEAHAPRASLIHGDLWAGNIVGGRWLIDPAVAYADREMELAFMTMFGGIPQTMFDSYLDEWPLDDGWDRRRPALRLHHLLVHVRLFGGGYVQQLARTIERLGW